MLYIFVMFKRITSNALIISALFSGSLFMCSCDSSGTLAASSSIFFDDDKAIRTTEISGLGVDPDFQSIVDRFVIEANKRNVSMNLDGLDIQYGDTDGAYGECSYIGTDTKDIVITPDLRNSPDDLKDEIVLHELGHCILGRKHSSNPSSIMHATNIIGEPWRTEVLDELFSL